MDNLSSGSIERLKASVYEGDAVRDFCKHPGFKIYSDRLNEIINDSKNTWLTGTEEDAKNARFEARGVKRALDELKKFMLSGDGAKRILLDTSINDLQSPTDSGQAQ
jgi:hypothetical protein